MPLLNSIKVKLINPKRLFKNFYVFTTLRFQEVYLRFVSLCMKNKEVYDDI